MPENRQLSKLIKRNSKQLYRLVIGYKVRKNQPNIFEHYVMLARNVLGEHQKTVLALTHKQLAEDAKKHGIDILETLNRKDKRAFYDKLETDVNYFRKILNDA